MKKSLFIVFAILVAAGLVFSGALQSVQADQQQDNNGPTPTPTTVQNEGIADGDWSSGSEPDVDLSKINPPKSYMQLLGEGVKATEKGRICHPFRGGEYGWWGNLYQLDHGKWTKVTTYFIWYPDSEGEFMACTYATPGAVYALFGAFNETINPTATLPPTATPTRTPTPKPTSRPPGGGPTQMNRT